MNLSIESFQKFRSEQATAIAGLAATVGGIDERAHWDLVDQMMARLGAAAATGTPAYQWLAHNCAFGMVADDVAMALWLHGPGEGEMFLKTHPASTTHELSRQARRR